MPLRSSWDPFRKPIGSVPLSSLLEVPVEPPPAISPVLAIDMVNRSDTSQLEVMIQFWVYMDPGTYFSPHKLYPKCIHSSYLNPWGLLIWSRSNQIDNIYYIYINIDLFVWAWKTTCNLIDEIHINKLMDPWHIGKLFCETALKCNVIGHLSHGLNYGVVVYFNPGRLKLPSLRWTTC